MKLNAFQLKMFALAAMLAEHHGEFLSEWLPARLPLYLDYVGRIVAPIFFFLAVESYFKTSNRRRYLARLYAWALFMLVGNLIVAHFVQAAYQPERFFPVGHNIFLSIAVGVSMVASFEWGHSQAIPKKWGAYALAALLACASIFTEASYNGLAMFLVFYFFYNRRPALYFAYAGLCSLFLLWGLTNPGSFWQMEFQWMMIAALPLIILYSGERGRYSLKYLFYAAYPIHIWTLYWLKYAL